MAERSTSIQRRNFLKYAGLLPFGVTAAVVGNQIKEGLIAGSEITTNLQEATVLDRNPYLHELHEGISQQLEEAGFHLPEEYGPWHSLQVAGLQNAAAYSSNEIFTTTQDTFKTMTTINTIANTINTPISINPQEIYTMWANNSGSDTFIHLGLTSVYQAMRIELNNIDPNSPNLDTLARRDLLRMIATGSALAAAGFAYQLNRSPQLTESVPQIQFDAYKKLPVGVLNKITDLETFHRLNEFISPNFLKSQTNTQQIDENTYNDALTRQKERYQEYLEDPFTSEGIKVKVTERMAHLEKVTYDAYVSRLAYTKAAVNLFTKNIVELPVSDSLLSIQFNDEVTRDEPILNCGIGLSVYYSTLMHQSVPHGTSVSSSQ